MSEAGGTTEATKAPRLILTLDGGGAKGFYTLGVLKEIEAMVGSALHKKFELIFGTSTGSIIASLLALGYSVDQILDLYREHVPTVMKNMTKGGRTRALAALAQEIFGDTKFDQVKTGIGVVATRWLTERPMIFKGNVSQAHGRAATFVPGFGVKIGDAVRASCSAYPFFERTIVTTGMGEKVELIDGGYCANNPTLYAIAEAVSALDIAKENLRLLSVGVGVYPAKMTFQRRIGKLLPGYQLLQKTLEINTQSMDQLRHILFSDVATIRINETFTKPEMATDLLEHDLTRLDVLFQRGRESFSTHEQKLREFFL